VKLTIERNPQGQWIGAFDIPKSSRPLTRRDLKQITRTVTVEARKIFAKQTAEYRKAQLTPAKG
jgi:arsenate reductase-like glutaredoxin family protein